MSFSENPVSVSRFAVNQIRGTTQAGSTGSGIPKQVTNVQANVSNASKGTTSTVTILFQRDPGDKSFAGVTVYGKGYQNNQTPVQLGAGSDSPVTLVLNNTGEAVTLLVQAYGNGGNAPLASSPTCGIKLPKSTGGGYGTTTTTYVQAAAPSIVASSTNPILAYAEGGNNIPSISTNAILIAPFQTDVALTFSNLTIVTNSFDGVNLWDFGMYDTTGKRVAHVGPQHLSGSANIVGPLSFGSTVTLSPGTYLYAATTNASPSGSGPYFGQTTALLRYFTTASTSSGGALPATITLTGSAALAAINVPTFILT